MAKTSQKKIATENCLKKIEFNSLVGLFCFEEIPLAVHLISLKITFICGVVLYFFLCVLISMKTMLGKYTKKKTTKYE